MCYSVYIGTNQKQTTTTWKEGETLLCLRELSKDDEIVKTKFSKTNIYYVGADKGCSCGFAWTKCNIEDFNDPEEQERKKSPQKLIDLIASLTEKESIEFYCCWVGDWNEPITKNLEIDIKDVGLDKFYFMEEKQFILFRQQMSD